MNGFQKCFKIRVKVKILARFRNWVPEIVNCKLLGRPFLFKGDYNILRSQP